MRRRRKRGRGRGRRRRKGGRSVTWPHQCGVGRTWQEMTASPTLVPHANSELKAGAPVKARPLQSTALLVLLASLRGQCTAPQPGPSAFTNSEVAMLEGSGRPGCCCEPRRALLPSSWRPAHHQHACAWLASVLGGSRES
jgi:hypothetical protein